MNTEPLTTLKGIGEKTEKLFAKVGIYNLQQLLHYYPRDYDCYAEPVPLRECRQEEKNAVYGRIVHSPSVKGNQRKSVVVLELYEEPVRLQLTWFNMPFLRSTLKKGSVFIFRGKIQEKSGRLVMEQPEIFTPAAYHELLASLQPVYGLTAGLTNKMVSKAVAQVLERCAPAQDYLPEKIRARYELCEINYALHEVHFPKDQEHLATARRRIVFEEFFLFILSLRQLKEQTEGITNAFPIRAVWKTEEVIENMPYRLTNAQMRVWGELERDLKGHTRMARLVQGDVGSGKTILAFLAMIMTAENGYQSALMVPTEVLARQHYESLCTLLKENNLTEYNPRLLTGSTKAKERREIYASLEDGSCKMVIGTHALIQEKVQYKNLALVITDEQHRFGVRQRGLLAEKAANPHLLVMSATPIPRTLGLLMYGDLDISILDELPPGRKPVKTRCITGKKRADLYGFLDREIDSGRQVYIVCPAIEDAGGSGLNAVKSYYEDIAKAYLPDRRVGLMHGRLKPKEKAEVMDDFKSGRLDALVSTTVIEVGVDVPNATVMVIENAERYGLSALHQLRGRVGRGAAESWCFLVSDNASDSVQKRLRFLCSTSDGFAVAQYDLETRGPGDFFGSRQHGLPTLQIADLMNDTRTLHAAQSEAVALLAEDPLLERPEHALLARQVEQMFDKAGAMN